MKQTPTTGRNLTGISAKQQFAEAMERGAEEFPPTSHGSTEGAGKVRVSYAKAGIKDFSGLGSVPPPTNLIGKAKAAFDKIKGDEPVVLTDKLGERLAFERMGTRLYEALISKHEAYGTLEGGPSRADLLEILNEEHRHFTLLKEAIIGMGGDPTAMTPSADIAATASQGVLKVITDPRTSLLQALQAILIAELSDREGWDSLIELSRHAGKNKLVRQFEGAQRTEEEHVRKVRGWIKAMAMPGARAAQ